MKDSLVVEEGMFVQFPLVPFATCPFPCSSCFKVISNLKKLNNHIVEIHTDPTS